MTKKACPEGATVPVTAERSRRLVRLLKLLSTGPQTRAGVIRRLRLGVRGFYRDLEVLRSAHIVIQLTKGKYSLEEAADNVLERLPFPDPLLSLGEARRLARGHTAAHKKLRDVLARIEQ